MSHYSQSVGKTRRKLAEMICQLTGVLIEPHELQVTNPRERYYRDNCAWDGYGTMPAKCEFSARRVHVYSFDTMGFCVKHGIAQITEDWRSTGGVSNFDFEICAK